MFELQLKTVLINSQIFPVYVACPLGLGSRRDRIMINSEQCFLKSGDFTIVKARHYITV